MNHGVLELAGKLNAGVKQLVADKYIGSYLEVAANPAFDFFGSLSTTKTLSFWTSFGLRPDKLYDKCTTLTGWTNNDSGTGISDQGSYASRPDVFRQRVNTGAGIGDVAQITKTIQIPNCMTFEFDLYLSAIDSVSNKHVQVNFISDWGRYVIEFASGGCYLQSNVSPITTVSTGSWIRWRFEFVRSNGKAIVYAYKDNVYVGTQSDNALSTAGWNSGLTIGIFGVSTSVNNLIYWDNIKISSEQNEKPLSPASVGGANVESFVGQYDDANNYWHLYFYAGSGFKVHFRSGGVDYASTVYANDITDSDEHHVMLIVSYGVVGLYVDGQQIGYSTFAVTKAYTGPLTVGIDKGTTAVFNGTIRDIFIQDANTFSATPTGGLFDTITVPTSNHVPTVDTVFCVNTDGYQDFSRYVDSSASGLTVRNRGVLTDNHAWTYGNGAARFSGGTQNKIVVANLDGDKMGELTGYIIGQNGHAGSNNLILNVNCDAGSNYEKTRMIGNDTTALGQYDGVAANWRLDDAYGLAANQFGFLEFTFETRRKGAMRSMLLKRASMISGTTVSEVAALTLWWNNTTDNIDVLVFDSTDGSTFLPGSHLIMSESSTEDSGQPMGDVNVMGRVSAGVMQLIHHHEVVSAPDAVKLLLHFDGNDGDTIVTDSSSSKHVITANGDFKISNAVGFVGKETSGYFDGTGDYLSIPDSADWDFGSGDFTIEGKFVRGSFSSNQFIIGQNDSGGADATISYVVFLSASNYLTVWWYESPNLGVGSRHTLTSSVAITDSAQHHFALVRNGNILTLYQDGVSVDTEDVTGLTNYNSTYSLTIGRFGDDPIYYFNGWIGEVRITKGIAQYTADFTPPIRPHRGNRSHYLKIGDSQNAAIVDECGHVVTKNGNVYKTTDVKIAGNGSCFFDGSTGFLTVPDSDSWNFGTANFTLESDIIRKTGANVSLFNQVVDTNNRWDFTYVNSVSQFSVVVYSASSLLMHLTSDTIVLDPGVKHHIALVRNGTTSGDWYLFVNGTQVTLNLTSGGWDASFPNLAATLNFGRYSPSGYYLSGYADRVRVSSSARYTSSFTPSWQPYEVDSDTELLLNFDFKETSLRHYPDQYTSLLIHGINGNDETDVLDSSVYNHTISCYGGARISGGFIDFDGSTGYLQIPDSEAFTFGGSDLTIDFKYTPTDYTGNQRFFSHRVDEDNEFVIMLTSSNELLMEVDSGGSPIVQVLSSALSWTNGVEYHIACVRYGNVWTIYRDGVSVATITDSSSVPILAGTVLIGQAASGNYVDGKLRQIRVSKGIARWVTDFTPPSTTYDGEFTQAVGAELLDGDKDALYLVHGVIASESSGIATINMRVNEDTGNNYGLQRLSSTGSVSAQRYTAQPYIAAGSANNAQLSVLERVMFASGGVPKVGLSSRGEQIPASSYATEFHVNGEVYNSLLPVSALELKGTLANSIGVGSEISVYALRKR